MFSQRKVCLGWTKLPHFVFDSMIFYALIANQFFGYAIPNNLS